MVRSIYCVAYAACAALGIAAVARPAARCVHGIGWFRSAGLSHVPARWAFAVLALAIGACALSLAIGVALERPAGSARHALLLVLVAIAIALRATLGDA